MSHYTLAESKIIMQQNVAFWKHTGNLHNMLYKMQQQ